MAADLTSDGRSPVTCGIGLLVELGNLASEYIEVLDQAILDRPDAATAPTNCGRRTAPFWRAVPADRCRGFWDSPQQAVTGLEAGAATLVAKVAQEAPGSPPAALRARVPVGPQPAAVVLAPLSARGVSQAHMGRATRRMAFVPAKAGLDSRWKWAPPEGGEVGVGFIAVNSAKCANTATREEHHV